MAQPTIVLWYNPACSKCRSAKQLLEEAGCRVERYEYLTQPPDEARLRAMLAVLGQGPHAVLRTSAEDDPSLADADDDTLIAEMLARPILIQRPIAIRHDTARAVVARPPELALQLLED